MQRLISLAFLPAILFMALTAVQPAMAQSKTEKTHELLSIMQTETLLQSMLPNLLAQHREKVSRLHPDIPDAAWTRSFESAEKVFRSMIPLLIKQCVPIYENNFSEEEIDALLAFYRTPVGRSVIAKLPKVTQSAMLIGHSWGKAAEKIIKKVIATSLAAEGYQI